MKDRRSFMIPKYKWIADQLKELIQNDIRNGINKLPTEQELCQTYGVSRQTIRTALDVLEKEKKIRRIKGSGSYITGLEEKDEENVIGILIPDGQMYLYPALIDDIRTALAREGYSCKILPTYGHPDQERQILQFLLKNPLRGLIVEPLKSALPSINTDLYQKLIQQGTAILFLNCAYPALSQIPVLEEDNIYGAGLLVQALLERGHTSIAGIFQMDDIRGLKRCQGFLDAMQNHGLLIPDKNICWFTSLDIEKFRQEQNLTFLKHLLTQVNPDCTAFICQDDFIAWLLWEELHAPGLNSPDSRSTNAVPHISLAAFNTSYLTTSGLLKAVTLTHPAHQPGALAAQMITDKLKGLPVSTQEVPWLIHQPRTYSL